MEIDKDFVRKQLYESIGQSKGLTYEEFLPEADKTIENIIESSIKCDIFYKEYNENHKYCPKCGHTGHSTTLAGYILNLEDTESYKDLNDCVCSKCRDKHTVHERVKTFN